MKTMMEETMTTTMTARPLGLMALLALSMVATTGCQDAMRGGSGFAGVWRGEATLEYDYEGSEYDSATETKHSAVELIDGVGEGVILLDMTPALGVNCLLDGAVNEGGDLIIEAQTCEYDDEVDVFTIEFTGEGRLVSGDRLELELEGEYEEDDLTMDINYEFEGERI